MSPATFEKQRTAAAEIVVASGNATGGEMGVQKGYFAEFNAFCRCYLKREDNLSEAIVEAMGAQYEPPATPIRILDVGSADGRLLRRVLERLSVCSHSVVCLEPCADAFGRIVETLGRGPLSTSLYQETLEAWLPRWQSSNPGCFDLIICSHVHYHFKNPPLITERLTRLLSPSGVLVAIIDSHDSPLYRWLNTQSTTSNRNAAHLYGDYFGFEDLRGSFAECRLIHTQGSIDSELVFGTALEFERAVAFLSRRALADISSEQSPDWARCFPCKVNWREGVLVVRGSVSPVDSMLPPTTVI